MVNFGVPFDTPAVCSHHPEAAYSLRVSCMLAAMLPALTLKIP
jgi:hypothetical protein